MTAREANARIVSALVSGGFAAWCYSYFQDSMRAACPCCHMGPWPFQFVRWLAASMLGLIVYYFLGLARGRWAEKSKG
jgi:hypothetical protein